VLTVQRLLTTAAQKLNQPQFDPHGVDGKIAHPPAKSNTVAAIESFEASASLAVDGIIAPGSPAWQSLVQAAS
jgi:peptidoglycan hydrolase-like protein with peptidoglycan-binding domain